MTPHAVRATPGSEEPHQEVLQAHADAIAVVVLADLELPVPEAAQQVLGEGGGEQGWGVGGRSRAQRPAQRTSTVHSRWPAHESVQPDMMTGRLCFSYSSANSSVERSEALVRGTNSTGIEHVDNWCIWNFSHSCFSMSGR